MSRSSEPEDERVRFGTEPARLEEREYRESLVPGTDEYPVELDRRGWRRTPPLTVDEDGEA